jgi:hypothetical protein
MIAGAADQTSASGGRARVSPRVAPGKAAPASCTATQGAWPVARCTTRAILGSSVLAPATTPGPVFRASPPAARGKGASATRAPTMPIRAIPGWFVASKPTIRGRACRSTPAPNTGCRATTARGTACRDRRSAMGASRGTVGSMASAGSAWVLRRDVLGVRERPTPHGWAIIVTEVSVGSEMPASRKPTRS